MPEITHPMMLSINLFVLACLLLWNTYTSIRLLKTARAVLETNGQLMKIAEEARDIVVEQQEALNHAGQAAMFWYRLWLQTVAKK